jgi:U3 small nucleolar RNA-associated protein 3
MSKRVKEAVPAKAKKPSSASEDSGEEDETADQGGAGGKRRLTYQIEKNKGTTPYRKKEYRNPRVKHRIKYRKAQISRKGQVLSQRRFSRSWATHFGILFS